MNDKLKHLLELRKVYIEIASYHLSFKEDGWEAKFEEATNRRDAIQKKLNDIVDFNLEEL